LLCGYSPFRSETKIELTKETTRGKLEFHERYWKKVSDEGEDGRGGIEYLGSSKKAEQRFSCFLLIS
jgi:hypothetical protein